YLGLRHAHAPISIRHRAKPPGRRAPARGLRCAPASCQPCANLVASSWVTTLPFPSVRIVNPYERRHDTDASMLLEPQSRLSVPYDYSWSVLRRRTTPFRDAPGATARPTRRGRDCPYRRHRSRSLLPDYSFRITHFGCGFALLKLSACCHGRTAPNRLAVTLPTGTDDSRARNPFNRRDYIDRPTDRPPAIPGFFHKAPAGQPSIRETGRGVTAKATAV